MNSFTVQYKHENGDIRDITRYAVFPFSYGLLLDERLDEAYLTLIEMKRKYFKPLTEFYITLDDGKTTKTTTFIVARDTPTRNMMSGRWKHRLYLLEQTKKLEGLLCPSITFTNGLPRDYSKIASRVIPENDYGFQGSDSINTPAAIDSNIVVPSPFYIGRLFVLALSEKIPTVIHTLIDENPQDENEFTHVDIDFNSDGETAIIAENQTSEYVISAKSLRTTGTLIYTYSMVMMETPAVGNSYYLEYRLTFNVAVVKTYAGLKKYTITDCVNRVLECAEPLRSGSPNDTPRYKFDGVSYGANGTYIYAEGSQAEEYDEIIAPEFTMTQCTLREQLKVIGSFIHAEPRLVDGDTIIFEPYGNAQTAPIEGLKSIGESGSVSINEYCTEIRSNAQNLVSSLGFAQGTVIDPGEGWYRSLRTESMYVRIGESNGIIQTGLPIYSLREEDETQITCGILNSDGTWWLEPCNITPFIFESTEYSANLSSYSSVYPYSKSFALYYTQGSKNINGLFFRPEDASSSAVFQNFAIANILGSAQNVKTASEIQNHLVNDFAAPLLAFNVKYKPIYPTLVSHGKSLYVEGETRYAQIYNQSENLIETQYFGENIKGVAARLGNVEREVTFMLSKITSIPELGQMYDGFAISAVSVEFQPYAIKCTVGLSKDFNRISEYVGVNSVKRMYEISERQVYNRDILIHNTLIIGKKPSSGLGRRLFKTAAGIRDIFFDEDDRTVKKPISTAIAIGYTKNGTELTPITLPVIPTSLGNAMTFYFAYKDNYSAGTDAVLDEAKNGVIGYWQNDVRYTDYYGRLWDLAFLLRSTDGISVDKSFPVDVPRWTDGNTPSYPVSTSPAYGQYKIRKDGRERLSITAELEVKTEYDDIIVGSALARFSRDVTTAPVEVQMLIFIDDVGRVNKLEQKYSGKGFHNDVTHDLIANIGKLNSDGSFKISSFPADTAGKGWVIMTPANLYKEEVEDEDGNVVEQTTQRGLDVLLASNTPFEAGAPIFGYEADGVTPRNLDFYIINE